jgi:hypothetical protein
VKIEGRVKMTVLLDIRADINIMITEIADVVNLPILEIISLKIEIFTGYLTQLLGIYRKINI